MLSALIVEDHPEHRELLRANLALCGVKYFAEESTLKGALKRLMGNSFGVVCLDLKLEDVTAQETIATLPAIASHSGDAALIVVSGFTQACIPELEKYAGAVIAKPYNFEHFKEGFEKAMRKDYRPKFFSSLLLHCLTMGKNQAA